MAAKKAASKHRAPKKSGDAALLDRYNAHRDKAEHHRAQADLIEARLRTQGKEIRHQYPGEHAVTAPSRPKAVIVKRKS